MWLAGQAGQKTRKTRKTKNQKTEVCGCFLEFGYYYFVIKGFSPGSARAKGLVYYLLNSTTAAVPVPR